MVAAYPTATGGGITAREGQRCAIRNEWIVREAFLAYLRGDVARMMDYVAEDLDWTHFGQDREDPRPLVGIS